jgi:hypothetical protein
MSQLKQILDQVKSLPPGELVRLIERATEILEQKKAISNQATASYAMRFGSGRGSFQNSTEADAFLRSERERWD